MQKRLENLFLMFQKKGFRPIEIPGLIEDVFNILNKGEYCTIAALNQELEDLGWGIEIMDNTTYEITNSLVQ